MNMIVLATKPKAQQQAQNFRKLFLAMATDMRVMMIKLADRNNTVCRD
jgi:(p)ppGpp synthase/HD superfamily hydrolase